MGLPDAEPGPVDELVPVALAEASDELDGVADTEPDAEADAGGLVECRAVVVEDDVGERDPDGLLDPDADGAGEVVRWPEGEVEHDADEEGDALGEPLAELDRELESAPVLELVPVAEFESALEAVGEADTLAL